MLEPFQLPYVQRGLIEILILSVASGILGTWIILRGLAFFSHAVGTASFPGLVLAEGIGFAAPLGAFGVAAIFAGTTWGLSRRRGTAYDSLTAMVLIGFLAAGVILASDVFHSGSSIEHLLFGSLLLIDSNDIALAAVATAAVVAGSLLLGSRWLAAGFDQPAESAAAADSRWVDLALLALIAVATTAVLTVIGALLVTALFVGPAATVRLFTRRMWSWQLGSISLSAIEGTVGIWLAVKTNAPPGATIAILAGGVFSLAAIGLAALHAISSRGRAIAATTGTLIATLLVAGCGSSDDLASSGELSVLATTTQIGDFVREVGGGAVSVNQILTPNTDPHDYEPRPDDVSSAAGAKLVFVNGDNLDSWIDQLVDDSGTRARVVDLGAIVPVRIPGESEGAEASEFDPHWWHDPRNAEAAVREIAAQLAEVDPSRKSTFEANADAYVAELKALDASITGCLEPIPASDRKLVTDHDAFGYFADRYGIQVVGSVIPSQTTQAQPSAKDLSELAETIRREGVKAVFPESSLSPKLAQTIARETGASADLTLYGDTLGPADSSGDTYLHMEEANADTIARGLNGGERGCQAKEAE